MIRFLIVCATTIALALSTPTLSFAQNLSKLKCEDEKLIEIFKDNMNNLRLSNGKRVSSIASLKLIGTPKTKLNSGNKLLCTASIRISSGGESRRMRALLTLTQFSNGKMNYSIQFGY